jgi:hypothetical protein
VAPGGAMKFWRAPLESTPSPMKNICLSSGRSSLKSRLAEVLKSVAFGARVESGWASLRNTPTRALMGAVRSEMPCSLPAVLWP